VVKEKIRIYELAVSVGLIPDVFFLVIVWVAWKSGHFGQPCAEMTSVPGDPPVAC
jgi:hypothetical protein